MGNPCLLHPVTTHYPWPTHHYAPCDCQPGSDLESASHIPLNCLVFHSLFLLSLPTTPSRSSLLFLCSQSVIRTQLQYHLLASRFLSLPLCSCTFHLHYEHVTL